MSTQNIPVPRGKHAFTKSLFFVVAALALILTACSSDTQATSPTSTAGTTGSVPQQSSNLPIVSPELNISLFAAGTTTYYAPDSVEVSNGHVFIDYQNTTPKDCTDKTTSTIVEYTMDGKVVKTFSVPGHSDGMRADPTTHLLWVTSCEDGNPAFVTIDPTSGTVTPYTLPNSPHGGGFDDLYFLNGMTFIVASNPTLNSAGVNVFPAIYTITLSSGKATLKPVLMGNASAYDAVAKANTSLNLVDPDSLTVDMKGDLVLVDQAGNDIIYISNPGTPQQKVSRTPVGTQLDDTVWATTAHGRFLLTDGVKNATYWIGSKFGFHPGAVYTETPDDSGVVGLFGLLDPDTGFVTPRGLNFLKATGLLFVP
jgi:hypothetical protein